MPRPGHRPCRATRRHGRPVLPSLTLCEAYNRQLGTSCHTVLPTDPCGHGNNFDPDKPDWVERKLLDSHRIRGLGWAPQIELRDGIEGDVAVVQG